MNKLSIAQISLVFKWFGLQIPPARVFRLWELDMTSEGAEICIRSTMSIVKLINGEKTPKKYQGAMTLSLKVNTL